MSVERRLPMAGRRGEARGGTGPGRGTRGADEPGVEGAGTIAPDPGRLAGGWQHRFVAAGVRAEEMISLYRELGFEVAADPAPTHDLEPGCMTCFTGGGAQNWSIYTRRGTEAEHAGPEATTGAAVRPGAGTVNSGAGAPSPNPESSVGETHSTRVLRDEHQMILQVADALEASLDAAPSEEVYARIAKCIRFIKLFADACHHGKEEGLLFPALEAEGLPRDRGPIAVMLHEHRLGRRFASTMGEAIEPAREGDPEGRRRLVQAGRDYVGLIRGHILKEDNVLFDMADQLITGPRCADLCAAYDETRSHTFEGCTKKELEELGREIVG